MIDRLRAYVEQLFQDAPRGAQAEELQEELLANLIDRYRDLVAEGQPPEEAYRSAVDSIGDVDALLNALRREQPLPQDRGDLNRAANEQRVSLTGIARIEIQYTSDTVNLFRSETSELLVKEFMNRREPELLARIEVSGSTLRIRHGTRRLFLFPPFRSRIEIYLPAGYRGGAGPAHRQRLDPDPHRAGTGGAGAACCQRFYPWGATLAAAGALEAESASGSIHLAEATAKRLRLQAASGSLHLRRLTALEAAELRSTSGSLHLGELTAGSLDLGTASGSMRAECLRAAEGLRLHTTSGSIQLQRAEGRMELATSSGSIVVEGCRGAGSCATSSGSIRMRVEELQGDLSLRASSGGIRLGLAGGVACNLRARRFPAVSIPIWLAWSSRSATPPPAWLATRPNTRSKPRPFPAASILPGKHVSGRKEHEGSTAQPCGVAVRRRAQDSPGLRPKGGALRQPAGAL